MEITEYLKDENSIEITVYNKIKKTYTEIKINNYYQENTGLENEKDNKKGRGSKSKSSKKSKIKEKSNQMEIEEIKNNNKESEHFDNIPSIDITSEDTDDSLFLNTLFNFILI